MIQNRDISIWFKNEIWNVRLRRAVCYQSLLSGLITLISIVFLQTSLFHPFNSIGAIIFVPFSWRCWLVSIIAGLVVAPSSILLAQIMTPRNQSFPSRFLHNNGDWQPIGYAFSWAISQIIADLIIALCCLNLSEVNSSSYGVVSYGVLITSIFSTIRFFYDRRFQFEFPASASFVGIKNRIVYIFDKAFRHRRGFFAQFIGHSMAIVLVSFIFFGWRMCRLLTNYPTTFVEAVWHILICQPSVLWSIAVLSLTAQCRQSVSKVLFDLVLCEARLLKLLMDEGVDVNTADKFGKTALMHAATLGARAACQTLLGNERVDAELADYFGNTPLVLACSAGHDTVALLLLEHLKRTKGLEAVLLHLDVQNNNGDTALTLAIKNGHVDCANLLSEYFKPFQFVVPSSDPLPLGQEAEFFALGEALSVEEPLILKYLAFLDLRLLTQQRQPRVQQIFTVSRPGGHPRTWISIIAPMLQALQRQITMFEHVNERLASAWEYKIEQATAGRGISMGANRLAAACQPKHWNREWKLQSDGDQAKTAVGTEMNKQMNGGGSIVERMIDEYLPPSIVGLWKTDSLTSHETLWADLDLQLWDIEAIGHIIASSYTDDKYGVVQRDLPAVVGHLLDLYSASDRYARLATSQRVDQHQRAEMDTCLTALRDQLTAAMDEITNVFGSLSDIRLNDQQRILLKRLMDKNGFRK